MSRNKLIDRDLTTCAALGAIAGMRSLLPQAVVSRAISDEVAARLPEPFSRLASESATRLLSAAALMELAGDKLPGIPHRIAPLPLIGRVLSGAAAGFVAARQWNRSVPLFAGVGAVSATLAAFSTYHLRMFAVNRLRVSSTLSGLVEDGLALLAARWVVKRLKC